RGEEGRVGGRPKGAGGSAAGRRAQSAGGGDEEEKELKVTVRRVNRSVGFGSRPRPGMSATATISTDRRENVIAVPLQALVERDPDQIKAGSGPTPTPAADQNKNKNPKDKKPVKGVFVIQNNKTVFTAVETGITGDKDIESKSGLNEGQEIVTGPYRQLRTLKNDQAIKREDKNKKPAAGAGNENK